MKAHNGRSKKKKHKKYILSIIYDKYCKLFAHKYSGFLSSYAGSHNNLLTFRWP